MPKVVVEQAGLTRDLELIVQSDGVLIRSARKLREGWAQAAAELHRLGEDDVADWDSTIADGEDLL